MDYMYYYWSNFIKNNFPGLFSFVQLFKIDIPQLIGDNKHEEIYKEYITEDNQWKNVFWPCYDGNPSITNAFTFPKF